MSLSAQQFEEWARECVQSAQQADTPELREQLLAMAREWMEAALAEGSDGPRREQRSH
jgi:hypothetical protein